MSVKPNNMRNQNVRDEMFSTDRPSPAMYPKTKKKKWEDDYKRATFFVLLETMEELDWRVGSEKGEKTRIINEALQEYFKNHPR